MKNLLYVFVLAFTVSATAQSTLLRLNYKKGEKYNITITQKMTSDMMLMDMTLTSSLHITDSDKDTYSSEMKFTRVVMDVTQGVNNISYDSNKSDDELDQMGLMMKGQMAPMLSAVISAKGTRLGKVISATSSETFQGSNNLGESNVIFPEKSVKVGDTFTMEKNQGGNKMKMVYKVVSINASEVKLDMSGSASGEGDATIKGTLIIDRATGVAKSSKIFTKATVMGQEMDTLVETVTKRSN